MKIRIYYFSGTGNTEFVAKHIATEMKSSGQESIIKLIPITISTTISKSELAETDLIGIGYPIHAFNAPKIVYSFIEKLPAGSHKRVFIFRSAGDPILHSGGTTLVRSALFRKEFRVVYERLFIMPANVFVEFNPKLSKQLVDHCKIQARLMAKELIARKIRLLRYPKYLHYISAAFSKAETMGTGRLYRYFLVNSNCNLCKVCIANCPMENISLLSGKNGEKIHFGKNCTFCLRCIYSCPKKAITIKFFRRFFILKEYNLRKITRLPETTPKFLLNKKRGFFAHYRSFLSQNLSDYLKILRKEK